MVLTPLEKSVEFCALVFCGYKEQEYDHVAPMFVSMRNDQDRAYK